MKEVEIRAKITDNTVASIERIGAVLKYESHEIDDYFKFGKDIDRKLVLRIRTSSKKTLLTFKGSAKGEDIVWSEWETEIERPEELKKLLLANGMVKVTTINKHRKSFSFGKFEINVDDIKNLGNFIEVQVMSENVSEARAEIEQILNRLGIQKEKFITKGYVPLMLESGATFK